MRVVRGAVPALLEKYPVVTVCGGEHGGAMDMAASEFCAKDPGAHLVRRGERIRGLDEETHTVVIQELDSVPPPDISEHLLPGLTAGTLRCLCLNRADVPSNDFTEAFTACGPVLWVSEGMNGAAETAE